MSDDRAQQDMHVRLVAGMTDVPDLLDEIVALLHSTEDPDPELILDVGCGVLESLLFEHEEELWPTIERLAREDIRFRRALAVASAYDSPQFERRESLLEELGERQTVTVSFIVEPDDEDFADLPRLEYRAVEIDGRLSGDQLPRMLRDIADRYERTHRDEPPAVMRDRRLREFFMPWQEARWALSSAWHEIDLAPNLDSRSELIRKIEGLVAGETAAWIALRDALTADADPT